MCSLVNLGCTDYVHLILNKLTTKNGSVQRHTYFMVHTGFIELYLPYAHFLSKGKRVPHVTHAVNTHGCYRTQISLTMIHAYNLVQYRIYMPVWYCINIYWYTQLLVIYLDYYDRCTQICEYNICVTQRMHWTCHLTLCQQ